MKDWAQQIETAEAAAVHTQEAEHAAERRFDAVHARAQAAGAAQQALASPEFHEWMAARRASDAAWGAWAVAMDAKPSA
ncbi:MAG TPA: hypothetical protein VEA35_02015 [Ramlibacter sp.]|nr:hypothetical protein [Ramlibacter sp.]